MLARMSRPGLRPKIPFSESGGNLRSESVIKVRKNSWTSCGGAGSAAVLTRAVPSLLDTPRQVMWILVAQLSCLFSLSLATTEWWGDLRAHLNPSKNPAFYDVTYDETAANCPQGLRSDAIPEYVYFGTMMATMTVNEHEECLQRCAEKPRCKAVNYFHPFAYQEKGFCELLSETQKDNPRLMRPFRKATYYEHIRCREVEEDSVDVTDKQVSLPLEHKNIHGLMKKLTAKVSEFNQGGFRVAR